MCGHCTERSGLKCLIPCCKLEHPGLQVTESTAIADPPVFFHFSRFLI